MEARHGAGSVAALTAAAAARLLADVARETSGWNGSAGVVAQASALAERCEVLAVEDAEAFTSALEALTDNLPDLLERMTRATAVPVEIAVVAADVAEAAVVVAERCDGLLRADAAGAAALAAGAAAAAAHLVRANLTVTPDDPRLKRALIAVDDARYSASKALDSGT